MKKLLSCLIISLALVFPCEGAFQIDTGTYTGNGVNDRSIGSVGFEGDWMIIFADNAEQVVCRTSANAGDATQWLGVNVADFADGIQAFEADGFQVGQDDAVNKDTNVYHYVVIGFAAADTKTVSYTGDGNDDRAFTGIGFQPNYLIIKGNNARHGRHMSSDNGADDSMYWNADNNDANAIQSLDADGFEIGSSTHVNENTFTFYYEAFLDVTNGFETGTYTGDGNDDVDISVGFQPIFVLVVQDGLEYKVGKTDTFTGEDSKQFRAANFRSLDNIQSLDADGFQIGTNNVVNENGQTFYWMAWKEPPSAAARRMFMVN